MVFNYQTHYPRLFLSHNVADKKFVRRLAKDLETCSITCWVDEAEIRVGESLIQKIGNAIDKTDFLAVVLSTNSVDSEWVNREVAVALTNEIKKKKLIVLPIVIEMCEIPPFLKDKLYADFSDPKNYVRALRQIIISCGENLDQAGTIDDSFANDVVKSYGTGITFFSCNDNGQYIPIGLIPSLVNTEYVNKVYSIGNIWGTQSILYDLRIPPFVFSIYKTEIYKPLIKNFFRKLDLPEPELDIQTFDPDKYENQAGIEVSFPPIGLTSSEIKKLSEKIILAHNKEIVRVSGF